MYNFDSYNVLLVIATNIPVLLMTVCAPGSYLYFVSLFAKHLIAAEHHDQKSAGCIKTDSIKSCLCVEIFF